MGRIVCLDTHVLIWGISKTAKPSQEYMIGRTANFLAWLQNEQATILIPAVVLAEFLVHIPEKEHRNILALFQRDFFIPSVDALTASLFASVWQKNRNNGLPADASREVLKIDGLLVATALACKAHIIYSEDPDIEKLAKGYIDVSPIPSIPTQPELI